MQIKYLVVHCTATPEGREVTAAEIRRWHREKGWRDIGYHYVVLLDGTVESGRSEATPGAHAQGVNQMSLGIVYAGGLASDGKTAKDTRTPAQKASLVKLLTSLKTKYPQAQIIGHRDVPGTNKACPSFNAKTEYMNL